MTCLNAKTDCGSSRTGVTKPSSSSSEMIPSRSISEPTRRDRIDSENSRPMTAARRRISRQAGSSRSRRPRMALCTVSGMPMAGIGCASESSPFCTPIWPSSFSERMTSSMNNGFPPVRSCSTVANHSGAAGTLNIEPTIAAIASRSSGPRLSVVRCSWTGQDICELGRNVTRTRIGTEEICPKWWRRNWLDASSAQCQSSSSRMRGHRWALRRISASSACQRIWARAGPRAIAGKACSVLEGASR